LGLFSLAGCGCVFSSYIIICFSFWFVLLQDYVMPNLASMIPVAGSAYTYSYATMGGFMVIGWDLEDTFRRSNS
jgi:amino acid transporter